MEYIIYIILILLVIIIALPLVLSNLGMKELDEVTRKGLGGDFVKLSDGFTHYELKGDKGSKTVVLVHGNAAPIFTWDHNVEALVGAGFRVLRYDIFGHGYSDRPKLAKYNKDLYDRQLTELMETLDISESIYLVGTSQGGQIAAHFIAKHPNKVAKVVFLAPLFDEFSGADSAAVKLLKCKGAGEYMMSLFGKKSLTNSSQALCSPSKIQELNQKLQSPIQYKGRREAALANMRGDSFEPGCIEIDYKQVNAQGIPAILTWGDKDKMIPKESMERMKKAITNLKYYEIKNAGHLAHYESAEEINNILIQFFSA